MTIEAIEAEILKLTPGARAMLAKKILRSLEGLSDVEIEKLTAREKISLQTELMAEAVRLALEEAMNGQRGDRLTENRGEMSELGRRAHELYARLRPTVETPENMGKIIVMDVESGDYAIDDLGIESSLEIQRRHPGVTPFAIRIGYKTVGAFGGNLERMDPL